MLKPYDTLSSIWYWAACTAKSFNEKLAMLIIISKVLNQITSQIKSQFKLIMAMHDFIAFNQLKIQYNQWIALTAFITVSKIFFCNHSTKKLKQQIVQVLAIKLINTILLIPYSIKLLSSLGFDLTPASCKCRHTNNHYTKMSIG